MKSDYNFSRRCRSDHNYVVDLDLKSHNFAEADPLQSGLQSSEITS